MEAAHIPTDDGVVPVEPLEDVLHRQDGRAHGGRQNPRLGTVSRDVIDNFGAVRAEDGLFRDRYVDSIHDYCTLLRTVMYHGQPAVVCR